MIKLVRRRIIPDTLRKILVNEVKILRYSTSKDDKSSSACAEKSQDLPNNFEKPEPPPCPPPPPPCGPPLPPRICSITPDPNNPCNYVHPENADPDEPDMTRIKRLQCLYQQDDGIPVYLKGGKFHVYFFHFITLLGVFNFLQCLIMLHGLVLK